MCRDSSFLIRPLVNGIVMVYMYVGMFSVVSVTIVSEQSGLLSDLL